MGNRDIAIRELLPTLAYALSISELLFISHAKKTGIYPESYLNLVFIALIAFIPAYILFSSASPSQETYQRHCWSLPSCDTRRLAKCP